MILVVGATGQLGGAIAQGLLAEGRQVRILVRPDSPSTALAQQGLATCADSLVAAGAIPVTGDLKDPASLAGACAGIDVVITTANSVLRGGADTIETVDRLGTRSLIDAAAAAGVGQFVYVSALGASPDAPVPLFAAKGANEAHLRESGMHFTILSPTAFMEIWPGMVVGMPAMTGQPVRLVGEATNVNSFVSAADVAAYACAVVDHPAALDRQVVISGPEPLSYRDVVRIYERALGRKLPVEFVAPGDPIPGLPPMMVAVLAGLTDDIAVDSSENAATFGIRQTSLADWLARMVPVPA